MKKIAADLKRRGIPVQVQDGKLVVGAHGAPPHDFAKHVAGLCASNALNDIYAQLHKYQKRQFPDIDVEVMAKEVLHEMLKKLPQIARHSGAYRGH